MTADYLRELLSTLESLTMSLHKACQERDAKENEYNISKSNVESLKAQKDLIKEKIMAEKILIKEIK